MNLTSAMSGHVRTTFGCAARWGSSWSARGGGCTSSPPTCRPPARRRSPAPPRWPGPRNQHRHSPTSPPRGSVCLRRFAVYLHTIAPATEVPPAGVFPRRRNRPIPYLWSPAEIARLLDGTRELRSPLRAATHQALFGLLAAKDMRLGEATS